MFSGSSATAVDPLGLQVFNSYGVNRVNRVKTGVNTGVKTGHRVE